MIISIDTLQPLSDYDRQILSAMLGQSAPETVAAPPATPKAPRAAKKAAAAEPAPSEDIPDDQAVADETAEVSDLKDQAVALASELLAGGQKDRVIAALKDSGAPRVSEIPDAALAGFIAALTD